MLVDLISCWKRALLTLNATFDQVLNLDKCHDPSSCIPYQTRSYDLMGSCSNKTFSRNGSMDADSGLLTLKTTLDEVENSDPFRRSHPFKWSTSDHEPKLVTLLINKWSPILKLPAMCIVHSWKQSLLGPHNPSTTSTTPQGEGDGKAEEEPACGELGALLSRGVGIYSLLSAIRETFSNCLGEYPWSLRISK